MHFWNKLSIAALMRLTILASLNLVMGRVVGDWQTVLHPLFFLSILTIDLGLYALMVYSGTLNKTLIGMMLGGLAAVLGVIAFAGFGPSAFVSYGSPFSGGVGSARVAHQHESSRLPPPPRPPRCPSDSPGIGSIVVGYVAADLGGADPDRRRGASLAAEVLQASSPGRDTPKQVPHRPSS